MARTLPEFIDHFVLPLLGGGDVIVGPPLRMRERDQWAEEHADLQHPDLLLCRLRRAQLLVADPAMPPPDIDELSLWIGLHNLLVFDHPDRRRVWSREAAWRRVEGVTRMMLSLPAPQSRGEALARHASVGALFGLCREDLVVTTPTGEVRSMGRDPSRRALRGLVSGAGVRQEVVQWIGQAHAPQGDRLLEDALRASPLSCVLRPLLAPAGWSPLQAADALGDTALVRAICYRWAAASDWVAVGGAVAAALLPSIGAGPVEPAPTAESADDHPLPKALPGAVLPTDPRALAGVVGALVHLHFLKVLELDARLGIGAVSREPGVTAFVALPLLLPWLRDAMGEPLSALADDESALAAPAGRDPADAPIRRRWSQYLDHLRELVPRSTTDKLLATLVPRIVQTP